MAVNQLPSRFVINQPQPAEQQPAGLPSRFVINQPGTTQPVAQPAAQQAPAAAQQAPSGSFNPFEVPLGIAETALSIGSGAVGEVVSGISGLAATPAGAETASNVVGGVQDFFSIQPQTESGQAIMQGVQDLVGEGVDLANSGLGGMARIIEEATGATPEAAAQVQADINEKGFSQVFADSVREQTGSDLLASMAKALPTAVLEVGGAKGALTGVSKVRKAEPPDIDQVTIDAIDAQKATTPEAEAFDPISNQDPPEVQEIQQIAENLANKNIKQAAIDAMPDAEILAAAQDLNVDLNPDHYSSSRAFRDVTQALKSRPKSPLAAVEEKAIVDLGKRADELIAEIGGQTDKSLLDTNVKNNINKTVADLETQSNAAYAAVDGAIKKSTLVDAKASKNYLQTTLDDLGGDVSLLRPAEKRLLALTKEGATPTYAALDRIRKDVGDGFNKQGVFKDESTGTLKQVYRALSEDQQGVADAFGVGEEYAAARKLVATRKGIEDNAVTLFGREVEKSILPQLKSGAAALTKGDVSKFNKLMEALPEGMRQEAAATMLNDLFTQGARTSGSLGGGFVKAFEGLNKNKGAKEALFKQLPAETRTRFDKIGKVTTGIFKSKALENKSKTARDVLAALEDGGIINNIIGVAEKTPVVGAKTRGIKIVQDLQTSAGATATEFVTSPAFKKAVETAAETGDPTAADKILEGTRRYENWKLQLTEEKLRELGQVGFIGFITSQNNEEQQ